MAAFAFLNAKVTVNAVDLSDHVKSVTINYSAEELDDTAMGATSHSRLPGLLDWSMDCHQQLPVDRSDRDGWEVVRGSGGSLCGWGYRRQGLLDTQERDGGG